MLSLTSYLRRGIALAALAGAGLAAAPAALAAEHTVLSTEQRATPVAAWNGTVAWSSFDPADGQYRLMLSREGGAPQPAPVASSAKAFDVDLGTNRNGSTYAVYTRCDPGCDVYRLSVATGVEQKLTTLSSPRWDEREPTIFRGQVAFIRHERHGSLTYDVVRIGDTTSASTGTRALFKVHATKDPAISGLELSYDRIAYLRHLRSEVDVRLRTLRTGRDARIYRAVSGGANFADVTRPSLTEDARALVWARTNMGSGTGNRLVRYTVATRRLSYAQGTRQYTSTGWAGASLGAAGLEDGSFTGTCFARVDDTPDQTRCRVTLTGPVAFDANP